MNKVLLNCIPSYYLLGDSQKIVKGLLKKNKLTYKDLSEFMNCSEIYICLMMNGKRALNHDFKRMLERELNISFFTKKKR